MPSALMLNEVTLTEKDFQQISGLVYRHCGINLHDGKKELVRTRLAKRLRQGDFKTFPRYINHVLSDTTGKEFSLLIDILSTNTTEFFRGQQHFDYLTNEFLSELIEKKLDQQNRRIRAWSAGCSSGEEAYTMAITLLEAIEEQCDFNWDVKVLGTDISTSMLEIATQGVYDKLKLQKVPVIQRQKYLMPFEANPRRFSIVTKQLRDTVILEYLNLMDHWPIKKTLDFIFCRNVMIYFDKATQQRLIQRFYDMLDTGGLLFTGHSESLTGIKHDFKYVQPTIYLKP